MEVALAEARLAAERGEVPIGAGIVGPDGKVVTDLDAKLPGRGHYLAPEREVIERAEAKGLIRRATGGEVEPGMAGRIEALMVRRLIDRVALARKAGQAVAEVLHHDPRYELAWIARRQPLAQDQSRPCGVPVLAMEQGALDPWLDAHPVDALVDFSTADAIYQYGEAVRQRG